MENQNFKEKKEYYVEGYIPVVVNLYVEAEDEDDAEGIVMDMSTEELLNHADFGRLEIDNIESEEEEENAK
jgi:hypothetical protein